MQVERQKKVARAYRVEGAIVLYRPATRRQLKSARLPGRAEPWWGVVIGVPLFLRTLVRLVIACPHRHKGPPITLRGSIPSHLPGRSDYGPGTYITCLDCGQKFAYDHKARRLVDFWGIRDVEARAGVKRKIAEFFSPVRGSAATLGWPHTRIPVSAVAGTTHHPGVLLKSR
jgi:hypothetical protein